jgi:hypothetical protein
LLTATSLAGCATAHLPIVSDPASVASCSFVGQFRDGMPADPASAEGQRALTDLGAEAGNAGANSLVYWPGAHGQVLFALGYLCPPRPANAIGSTAHGK